MCQPSKVTDDWVVKGCHIHIAGIELVVRPDHKGGVCFKPFFAVKPRMQQAVTNALNFAQEVCLRDPDVRVRWIRSLNQAITFMVSVEGGLFELASGRMAEFKFLIVALERYTE